MVFQTSRWARRAELWLSGTGHDDDDTGDNIGELSSVINNPSAEGFLGAVNTALPTSAIAVCGRTESVAVFRGE
jgi:hypothetical protein